MALFLPLFPPRRFCGGFDETMAMASFWGQCYVWFMLPLSVTFYLFSMAFRSWGSVERGPTFHMSPFIPVQLQSGIYSPILPLEEGYRIQAFSRYPCLVQQVMSPASSLAASKLPPRLLECLIRIAILHLLYRLRPEYPQDRPSSSNVYRVPS